MFRIAQLSGGYDSSNLLYLLVG